MFSKIKEILSLPVLLEGLLLCTKQLSEKMDVLTGDVNVQSIKIDEQFSRIEFVRNEIMYEIRHSRSSNAEDVVTKILNSEKIEKQKEEDSVILNMGCGHISHENMINIDARELPGVDIVADILNISLSDLKADEIYSSHVLEHFSQEQLKRQVLPNWLNLLKDGGLLRAIVPDAGTMIDEYVAGNFSFEDLRHVTFGAQEYEGDYHYNMFSEQSIIGILESVGLEQVNINEKGRRNGLCYEMEITGRKCSGAE